MANLPPSEEFFNKADACRLRIAIVGLGYVGQPLMSRFHEVGFSVVGIDVDGVKIARLNGSQSSLRHIPDQVVRNLVESSRASFTTEFSMVSDSDVVICCVPTPLTPQRQPDLSHVTACADAIMPYVRVGHLLVLESTVYPGATEEIFLPRLLAKGLIPGESVHLAYSPERQDIGNLQFSAQNTPRVCSGFTHLCRDKAVRMYGRITECVVPVSSIRTAEMTKLLENVQRFVNIGLVNEVKVMADLMDIDIHEVVAAAATKPFGFAAYYPGPGLGGHCIPVDPLYLTWKMKEYGLPTRFIALADEVNSAMPEYVVGKVARGLAGNSRSVRGSRILICGLAYKKNVGDIRESPAAAIIGRLVELGADVSYSDFHVSEDSVRDLPFGVKCVPCSTETLAQQDCVVIATDHDDFDYHLIKKAATLIVDTRGRYPRDTPNLVSA